METRSPGEGMARLIYAFEGHELDLDRFELRAGGVPVPVEPQVFALLTLLVENHERMVSRDEIVERVWDGRIVSESAISSRIKAARKAIGDDGDAQRLIKTIHGRGFRFVAGVRISTENPTAAKPAGEEAPSPQAPASSSIPSIAILPFLLQGAHPEHTYLAEALPHEVINALSRLRWLKVIARGSTFRFRESDPDVTVVGRTVNARYCLTGFIQVEVQRLAVSVELAETGQGQVVWSESFEGPIAGVHELRAAITSGIVSALETYVPMNEARVARLSSPQSLDAWAIYHLGLQHMFRFSSADNIVAADHFRHALELEPGLARAAAGLSFTAFQNAYHGFSPDRARASLEAKAHAELAVSLDPLDAFANFTLGRAHWLEGDVDASLGWLDRGTALSPSYAQCVYARGFADTMLCKTEAARPNLRRAMELSPIDPFLYAMKGTFGLTHLIDGDYATAVHWLDQAGRTPGSPAVVALVAAVANALAGDKQRAAEWIQRARKQSPTISVEQFYRATPISDSALRSHMTEVLRSHWS